MGKAPVTRLDRLFQRQRGRGAWVGVRDAWEPAWRPRGRWWMRSRDAHSQATPKHATHAWIRLTRPARAA